MQKWLLCGEKSYFRIRLNGIKWKSWLDKYFFVEWISCHNGVFLQSQFWILRKLINLVVAHGKGADDYLFHFLAKMCKIKSAQKEIWKEFHKSFWVNFTKHSNLKFAESSDIEKFAANIAIRANQYQGTVYWQIDSRFQPTLKRKKISYCAQY